MYQSYPNAAGGLKLIFIGEILSMAGSFLTMVGVVMAAASLIVGGDGSPGIVAILGLLLILSNYVLSILGLSKAGNDDASYRSALMFAIVGLVIALLNGLLISRIPVVGGVLSTLAGIVVSVLNYLIVHTVCQTTGNLLHSINSEALADRGGTVDKIYFICTAVSVVCTVVSAIPILGMLANVVSMIAAIVTLVGYIMYLSFLSGSSKALA